MAGARLAASIYSSDGANIRWNVVVWDTGFSGSAMNFTLKDDGFKLFWDGESDDLTKPLKSSMCRFMVYDDGSSEFASMITDLASSQENRFKLLVYRHDGTGFNLYWVGMIMQDLIEWDNVEADTSKKLIRPFEITAKDGLSRLQNIEFDKVDDYISGGISTPQTVLKLIIDCLSYMGTEYFWSTGTAYGNAGTYLKVNTTWKDANMVCDDSTSDKLQTRSLELIRIDRDFLFDHYNENKIAEYKYQDRINNTNVRLRGVNDPALNVYSVLENLLKILGLRMFIADGSWWITQIASYVNSTADYAEYDTTGTFLSEYTANYQKSLIPLADGKFGYFPSIKQAKCTTMPTDLFGQVQLGQILSVDSPSYNKVFDLGTLYGGTDLRLRISIPIQGINWSNSYGDVLIEITITIVAGSYRVKPLIYGQYDKGIMTWTTTSSDKYEYLGLQSYFSALGRNNNLFAELILETEDMPFVKEENCTMTVNIDLTRATGSLPAASKYKLELQPIAVAAIDATDGNYGQISEYVVYNPNLEIGNSVDVDFGNLNIHDTGKVSNKVSIETDEYVGAGRWTKSTIWDAGHTTDTTLVQTILKEAMSIQAVPVKRYTGAFIDVANDSLKYAPWNTIDYDGYIWVFNGLSYDAKANAWDGTWFAINRKVTDLVDNDGRGYNNLPDVNPIGLGPWNVKPVNNLPARPLGGTGMPQIKTTLLDTGLIGATFTSIDCDSVNFSHIRTGDLINVWHFATGELLQQFTVSQDVSVGDTTINVDSTTLTGDLMNYAEVGFDMNELFASNELRASETVSLGTLNNGGYTKILKVNTTGATSTELTTNGLTGSGITNRIAVPNDTSFSCKVYIVAKQSGSANCAKFDREFLITNNSGTTALQGAVATIGTDIASVPLAAASVSITANNTNDAINISVTGIALTLLNWTARVEITASKYA